MRAASRLGRCVGLLVLWSGALACREHEPEPRGQSVAEPRAPSTELRPASAAELSDELSPAEPGPCELVEPPPGLVDLADVVPDAIIRAGYHRSDNFTGAPLPGYEGRGAWLEREAAEALRRAAASLAREDLRLIIYDGYRPRRASEAMVAWAEASGRDELLTDGWIARRSAHNRGRAVDLGLADRRGFALDMGSAWDQFDRSSYLRGVEGPALERRLLLRAAMVEAGFVPYAREWWHFGFESRAAAPALDRPYACR